MQTRHSVATKSPAGMAVFTRLLIMRQEESRLLKNKFIPVNLKV